MLIKITIEELSVPHRKHYVQQFKWQAVKMFKEITVCCLMS